MTNVYQPGWLKRTIAEARRDMDEVPQTSRPVWLQAPVTPRPRENYGGRLDTDRRNFGDESRR